MLDAIFLSEVWAIKFPFFIPEHFILQGRESDDILMWWFETVGLDLRGFLEPRF